MSGAERILSLLLAALALIGAACGPGPRGIRSGAGASAIRTKGSFQESAVAPRSKGGVDPCKLVTHAEAEAAVGRSLGPAQRDPDSCQYQAGDSIHSLMVTETKSADLRGSTRSIKLAQAAFGDAAETVHGLGDAAFVVKGLNMIYVLSGDTFFIIQFFDESLLGVGGEDSSAKLLAMARTALKRV